MNKKCDWIIHHVILEDSPVPFVCNAHTHGMERYNHLDFQVVLRIPKEEIAFVLNSLGRRVQAGERFAAGDLVDKVFVDCLVRLDEVEETGRTVLRAIIPDENNLFPEDEGCNEIYRIQAMPTEALYASDDVLS